MPLTPTLKKGTKTKTTPSNKKNISLIKEESKKDFILKFRASENESDLSPMINALTKSPTNDLLNKWLEEMTINVSLLDKRAEKIILEFLKIPWYDQNHDISSKFHNFLVSLISAHNYYNYIGLKALFALLIPDKKNLNESEINSSPGVISETEETKYKNVLNTIVAVYKEVPLSEDAIMKFARKTRPYVRSHAHLHIIYTRNMLFLAALLPKFRSPILEIIISNMVTLDVRSPRSEIQEVDADNSDEEDQFTMEIEGTSDNNNLSMKHETGNTLDILMQLMFKYIYNFLHGVDINNWEDNQMSCDPTKSNTSHNIRLVSGCECGGSEHNIDMLKLLYSDLKSVFTRFIMCTHNSSHVQYLLFYMLAIRPGLVTVFLEYLFEHTFKSVNCMKDIRHNAIAYVGSLLARGKFISFVQVHSWLEMVCNWCHKYLENQERLESNCYEDLMMHSTFYHACQTIFYVFTFRYAEYTENPKKLNLARSLGMDRLVSCKLNPLKVCSPAVVSNFAAVTRRFQLVYCYTIIMNNKRLTIPTTSLDRKTGSSGHDTLIQFFPFDPCLLKRLKIILERYYREFGGLPDDCIDESDAMDTEDEDSVTPIATPKSMEFSYGSCDGYKR